MLACASLALGAGCSTGKTQTAQSAPEAALAEAAPQPPAGDARAGSVIAADGPFVASDHLEPAYFAISQSKLDDAAKSALQKNADWLKENPPFLLEIAGNADSRGSLKRNRTLAEQRAANVRDFYASLGIDKDRMTVTTLEPDESACHPLTEDCLSKSRRAETFIENKALASR